ncbi:MAG: alpha amylase C-terminal domain-containing protein [Lachnospiraceae bacterium]|nr:alpha amylase C-terminal domain-containing protein [Lachnospiraceae bacterium]
MKDKLYKMMSWPQIEAVVYGEEGNPQTILGRHNVSTYTLYQTFMPTAESVTLCISDDKKKYPMELADEAGFFAIAIVGKERRDYVYKVVYKDGSSAEIHDPYIYDVKLSKEDAIAWNKGTSYDAYRYMGSHELDIDGVKGIVFRVWAPNAIRASVVGDFNNWDGHAHPMMFDEATGIYSLFIPELSVGVEYMYEICTKGGAVSTKFDPYSTVIDNSHSVVEFEAPFRWTDKTYLTERKKKSDSDITNIFEIDNDLWNDGCESLDDKKISDLAQYVHDVGYTHVLINAASDYFFCMNPQLGSREVLKKLINEMHSKKIGVLFRWNPTCFAPDEEGLKIFDGTYLYGHLDDRKRYNLMFGYNFNYGREQVNVYLMSAAAYLFEEFHADGLHIEEISTILYLDYGKNDGEWIPNMYGGNENLEAIDFLKNVNTVFHRKYPGIITTTKETCMFPKVTYSVKEDGLGFDYIWDNGFSEDYLAFLRDGDTDIRKITDNMAYAYSENYILTISKEDVLAANDYDFERVAEGAGFYDYIAYEDSEKLKVKRATLAFMMARPGKKLVYLGQDEKSICSELNTLYRKLPALHVLDRNPEGFEWVYAFSSGNGVVAFLRKGEIFKDNILVVCNFSRESYEEYKLGISYEGKYKRIFCSEESRFGGDYKMANKNVETVDEEYDGKESSLTVGLPALSVSFFSYTPFMEEEFLKIAARKAEAIRKELEAEAERRAKELEVEALRKAKEYNSLSKRKLV